jgi:hypothetical protein
MLRRIVFSAALLAAGGTVWGDSNDKSRGSTTSTRQDRSFGTALQWEQKLEQAAKKAKRENKLLLVLAVAGHFEDPFFT